MTTNIADRVSRVLISEEEIRQRVIELGKIITKDYAEVKEDIVMVCILKGACIFMTDLMKACDIDFEIDFMSVSSYGEHTYSTGDVRIIKDLDSSIEGKHIIIVEDIIDTGYTLSYLKANLLQRGALSVKIASMLNKQSRRVTEIQGDYIAFEIPDVFVVGYGLDDCQKLRNLPFVGVVQAE